MSNACCKINQIISYFKKVYDHNSILSLNSLDETELCEVKKQLLKNLLGITIILYKRIFQKKEKM